MAGNSRSSQEYKRYNKNNIGQRDLLLAKNNCNENQPAPILWQGNKICISILSS